MDGLGKLLFSRKASSVSIFFHSLRGVNEYKWVGKKNRSREKLNLSNREEARTRSTHTTWLHKGKRVTKSTSRSWQIGKDIGGHQLHLHLTSKDIGGLQLHLHLTTQENLWEIWMRLKLKTICIMKIIQLWCKCLLKCKLNACNAHDHSFIPLKQGWDVTDGL
jgi:hypothetical protein